VAKRAYRGLAAQVLLLREQQGQAIDLPFFRKFISEKYDYSNKEFPNDHDACI
jgi:hypothetical protein